MFEKVKTEMVSSSARQEGSHTIVGASVKLKGNLKSDGDIDVEGVVSGELKTKGTVTVGKNANILANVKARNIKVAGMVQGNLEASEKLEITESGRVIGDISANVLVIAPGAVFTGKSLMSDHKEAVAELVEMEEVAEVKKEEKKPEKAEVKNPAKK